MRDRVRVCVRERERERERERKRASRAREREVSVWKKERVTQHVSHLRTPVLSQYARVNVLL